MEESVRRCPVQSCQRTLGTTRNGDPWLLCSAHYAKLTNPHRLRLWTSYRSWQRVERAYLKAKAEGIRDLKPHMDARAVAVQEYIVIRDDCIEYASRGEPQQLEMA